MQSIRCISKIYSHIQSEHPELSGPESVQQKESFEESDGLHESFEIFSESNDSDTDGERIKVDFSAIRKILSSIFPSSRGN